ncbi:hypothetical protein [Streptomyces laurentii]|uniref:hypothetical protein n=1 Tax=Streptomyces laurentii TaxID=39478 RepID=UPI003692767E
MTIDNWEAAVARRAEELGPGAGFRPVRLDVEPPDIDLLVDTFRDTSLPKVHKIPGLAGISLLIDRDRGRAIPSQHQVGTGMRKGSGSTESDPF